MALWQNLMSRRRIFDRSDYSFRAIVVVAFLLAFASGRRFGSLVLALAGADFMRSSRGALVLEVNASPGFGIEKVTRRNVAGKIIDYIDRNAKRGNKKDRVGA